MMYKKVLLVMGEEHHSTPTKVLKDANDHVVAHMQVIHNCDFVILEE